MSVFYQIFFPQNAPDAELIIRQKISSYKEDIQLRTEHANELLIFKQNYLISTIVVTNENKHLEFSFDDYFYTNDWYIEFGKHDGLVSMRFYIDLLGLLLTTYSGDFLSTFNGERIVAKKEQGQIYLNTEISVWNKKENLAVLGNCDYKLATYPVE